MKRIFVSSTVYDLIDIRAEVETMLRENGLTPVMSDSKLSGFTIVPDTNSIETCLSNVRSCDAFILILSQRYGPKLGKAGFENISATHLEYNEAVNLFSVMYETDWTRTFQVGKGTVLRMISKLHGVKNINLIC